MMSFRELAEIYRAFRGGAPLGDVALMKFAAMSETPPDIREQLATLEAPAPFVDVGALLALPSHTFGYAYANFLRANGLDHFNLSPSLVTRYKDNPYAIRYTVTHDLHHVLTGFDAGMAGEQGVVGFTVGQGIAPTGPVGLWFGRHISTLVSPTQASQVRHNYALGVRMGEAAKLLIAEPLESWFEESLREVREEVGIREADVAQVRASRNSWFANLMYGKRAPKMISAMSQADS